MRQPPSSLLLLSLWTPHPRETESFSYISPSRPRSTTDAAEFVGNEIGADLQRQQNIPESCVIRDDEGGILAGLFGSESARDQFFEHAFGRRVAYFPRSGKRSTPHGNENNNRRQRLAPPVSGIDLPKLYESNEWTSLRKRGSQDMLDKSRMSYEALVEYVAEGGSIVIPVTPDDYLFSTKLRMERAFGVKEETGTSVNIYHSGPSAVALNVHYDAWPVFVLQLDGEKEWMIQDDAFGLPEGEITQWKNVTMTEGDLLYIPKGVHHAATTAEGFSTTTHMTIGLTP